MKKRLLLAATAVMSMAMSTTAFAGMGSWQQNATGWWWQRTDNSYPADEWKWIDGNGDGTAESYYFDQNGYLITNTTTPDGYTVNADGAWVQDGVVQKRQVMLDLGDEVLAAQTTTQTNTAAGNPVMDGKSIEKIVVNPEIMGMMGVGGVDRLPNKTEIGQGTWGPTYNVIYDNSTLKVTTDTAANGVTSIYGSVGTIFNNIPATGIELNAFYDSCGYESKATGRRIMASTGPRDEIFGLASGSYRMAWGDVDKQAFMIVLTAGNDGKWYIYPDNPMVLN